MTEFDARLIKRNARTNDIINKLLKDMKVRGRPRVEQNLLDRVIRPYALVLNECELKEVEPVQVNEATISTIAAMCSELMIRTIPRGNTSLVQTATQDLITDFTNVLLGSIGVNFGVTFELAPAPQGGQPPPAATH